MPEYTAVCTACQKEHKYIASAKDRCKSCGLEVGFAKDGRCPECDGKVEAIRDVEMRKLKCCGAPFERKVFSQGMKPWVAFVPGEYDIGIGDPRHFDSDRELQRAADDYNREEAKHGRGGVRIKRRRLF